MYLKTIYAASLQILDQYVKAAFLTSSFLSSILIERFGRGPQ